MFDVRSIALQLALQHFQLDGSFPGEEDEGVMPSDIVAAAQLFYDFLTAEDPDVEA